MITDYKLKIFKMTLLENLFDYSLEPEDFIDKLKSAIINGLKINKKSTQGILNFILFEKPMPGILEELSKLIGIDYKNGDTNKMIQKAYSSYYYALKKTGYEDLWGENIYKLFKETKKSPSNNKISEYLADYLAS